MHRSVNTHTSWYYAATVPWERLFNFLQGSHQDCHAWSKQTRAGKPTGLMLLLHHLQKAVSLPWLEGLKVSVNSAPSSSGSNQVQQQMLLTIPDTACFDMTQGNRLALNICMVLNVLSESCDSMSVIIHSKHTQSKFKMHGCHSEIKLFFLIPLFSF